MSSAVPKIFSQQDSLSLESEEDEDEDEDVEDVFRALGSESKPKASLSVPVSGEKQRTKSMPDLLDTFRLTEDAAEDLGFIPTQDEIRKGLEFRDEILVCKALILCRARRSPWSRLFLYVSGLPPKEVREKYMM